jgi:AbrB family looped-hinge helix DNA binding protein
MRITTKGQVTIPQEIRERLGLLPHTEVEFQIEGDRAVLRRAGNGTRPGRGRRLTRHLRGRATVAMTTDEIMALARGSD